jgi:hypothetical protein
MIINIVYYTFNTISDELLLLFIYSSYFMIYICLNIFSAIILLFFDILIFIYIYNKNSLRKLVGNEINIDLCSYG